MQRFLSSLVALLIDCLMTSVQARSGSQSLAPQSRPGTKQTLENGSFSRPGTAQSLKDFLSSRHAAEAEGSAPNAGVASAQSPEVFAAAQALLQSQLQQLGIPPDQVHPQLLNLMSALGGAHSGSGSTPSVSQNPQSPPPGTPQGVPSWEAANVASERNLEMTKAAKLTREDSVRLHRQSSGMQDAGYLYGRPLEGVSVVKMSRGSGKKEPEGLQGGHMSQQHQAHVQAAAYAQQLCALLAQQAQSPQVCHTLLNPMSALLNPMSAL